MMQEFTHAGRKIRLEQDPEPDSPREWDNLGTMVHWHRRYDLGKYIAPCTREELQASLEAGGDKVLAMLPVYMYDHSGITVSTKPFGCRWDSGQVGWIYATQSRAEELGFDDLTTHDVYLKVLESEVETFGSYLRGEVYGFMVIGLDGEVLDSCGGFYDLKDCEAEARASAEHSEDPAVERLAQELSERATFAG